MDYRLKNHKVLTILDIVLKNPKQQGKPNEDTKEI